MQYNAKQIKISINIFSNINTLSRIKYFSRIWIHNYPSIFLEYAFSTVLKVGWYVELKKWETGKSYLFVESLVNWGENVEGGTGNGSRVGN